MTEAVKETIEQTTVETPKTYTEAEVAELVAGLKSNNEKLLSEKKAAAQQAKEAADARLIADQEAARKSGELEKFEKTLRGQYDPLLAEKDSQLTKMSERILGAERKSVISSIVAGRFIDAEATDIISQYVKVEFEGDDVVTKFVGADGSLITTDANKFIEYCKNHKVLSRLMLADAATGGGAGGNKKPGGRAAGVDTIQQRLNAKYRK